MSIHFGSIVNKAQQQELIMLSRLIASVVVSVNAAFFR
jgi:hypothetical protein